MRCRRSTGWRRRRPIPHLLSNSTRPRSTNSPDCPSPDPRSHRTQNDLALEAIPVRLCQFPTYEKGVSPLVVACERDLVNARPVGWPLDAVAARDGQLTHYLSGVAAVAAGGPFRLGGLEGVGAHNGSCGRS